MGCHEDHIKIAVVICQKRHHTRLVYENKDDESYMNLCPGIVVDSRGQENSITSASNIEFYLNSHVGIQGTCKASKYSLIYDTIGLSLSDIELITYWSTYLYGRVNRCVSVATPAYYAHWLSKRGRHLLAAGATTIDLHNISNTWSIGTKINPMYFI